MPGLSLNCLQINRSDALQKNYQNHENLHANCLIIGNQGILVCGPSGSGKTSLMLHLIDRATETSQFAAMVADDQTLLHNANGRLIGECPIDISGLCEIRGFGIYKNSFVASTVINLVVEIISPEKLARMPLENSRNIKGISLPEISVPQFQLEQSFRIITASMSKLCT